MINFSFERNGYVVLFCLISFMAFFKTLGTNKNTCMHHYTDQYAAHIDQNNPKSVSRVSTKKHCLYSSLLQSVKTSISLSDRTHTATANTHIK